MKLIAGLLGFLTSVCLGQQRRVESAPDTAAVEIVVTTTFGEPAGRVLVVLSATGPNATFRQLGTTISFPQVPFGLYDLEVQASGFSTRHERVGVYQSEVHVWIGLAVSPSHAAERSEVTGRIIRQEGDRRDLWVRLVSRYSSDLLEDRVSPSGVFRLAPPEPGEYLLLVFASKDVIAIKPIDFFGGKLTLDLDWTKKP
jgi:hypothetical protein